MEKVSLAYFGKALERKSRQRRKRIKKKTLKATSYKRYADSENGRLGHLLACLFV